MSTGPAARWVGLVAALALVGAAAAVGQRRARDLEESPLPSVASTGPRGLAAARAFLAATGRPALRLSTASDLPPAGAVVLLAAPGAALDEREASSLLAHAAAGGTLVWMADPVRQPALERRLALRAAASPGKLRAEPLAPHPLFTDLTLPVGAGSVEGDPEGALAVLGTGPLTSAVSVPLGSGEVLVLSGPEPLANGRIGEADSASLLVRLAARGPIAFDERWLVPRGAPAPPSRRGLAVLVTQALLAGGVLLLARARRLGAVRPPPEMARGRTARNYVESLAVLYRRAGAEAEIAAATWRRARRVLERRAGVPARLPAAEAQALLARRSRVAAEALGRGEAALHAGAGALLGVCRAADDLERAYRTPGPVFS